MTTEIMMNDPSWPAVGNPVPPPLNATSSEDPSHEWEMIVDEEENENAESTIIGSAGNTSCVVIFHGASTVDANRARSGDGITTQENKEGRRPRSATVGGEAAVKRAIIGTSKSSSFGCEMKIERVGSFPRLLRRCNSTPDLVVSDNAHEVIVEDESDSEDYDDDDDYGDGAEQLMSGSSEGEEVVVERSECERDELEEGSFEVLSEKHHELARVVEDDEPFMIEMDVEGESATLVSSQSVGTSWTIPSSVVPNTLPTSVWGMKKSPSFKDVLLANKNVDIAPTIDTGVFGKDRVHTEAKLRDPNRHHHLRIRTKPKFIITDNGNTAERGIMKHAFSTGDLTKMLSDVAEGHENSIGQGRRIRRSKKQLSAMTEEDEDGDFVIGRGSGNGDRAVGGSGGQDIFGETDAMDYYQRKEHGSKSISNKKKERPDEAKRREITMYKKEVQRRNNGESQMGGTNTSATLAAGDANKKKKNDKGVGGKKERRRL